MKQIRTGIFETNSSSSHSITLYYGDTPIFDTIIDDLESVYPSSEWELDESSIDKLLSILPLERLEKEIEKKKKNGTFRYTIFSYEGTHAVEVHLWNTCVTTYINPEDDLSEITLDELDCSWILANIPTEELEAELKNRKDNEANV